MYGSLVNSCLAMKAKTTFPVLGLLFLLQNLKQQLCLKIYILSLTRSTSTSSCPLVFGPWRATSFPSHIIFTFCYKFSCLEIGEKLTKLHTQGEHWQYLIGPKKRKMESALLFHVIWWTAVLQLLTYMQIKVEFPPPGFRNNS